MTLDEANKIAWIKLDGKSAVIQLNGQTNARINVDANDTATIHIKDSNGLNSLQP